MDHALKTRKGVRIPQETSGKASHLVCRLNYARNLARLLSMEVFEEDDPKYGIVEYDRLMIRKPKEVDGKWWVFVERDGGIDLTEIEEL
jgi:hypothetical protein